jgi:hypothetical protein
MESVNIFKVEKLLQPRCFLADNENLKRTISTSNLPFR